MKISFAKFLRRCCSFYPRSHTRLRLGSQRPAQYASQFATYINKSAASHRAKPPLRLLHHSREHRAERRHASHVAERPRCASSSGGGPSQGLGVNTPKYTDGPAMRAQQSQAQAAMGQPELGLGMPLA